MRGGSAQVGLVCVFGCFTCAFFGRLVLDRRPGTNTKYEAVGEHGTTCRGVCVQSSSSLTAQSADPPRGWRLTRLYEFRLETGQAHGERTSLLLRYGRHDDSPSSVKPPCLSYPTHSAASAWQETTAAESAFCVWAGSDRPLPRA
jgi:hypothetical protein